jgi:hypothetical protein
MKLKILIYTTLLALTIFFCKYAYSQEVVISSSPSSITYLMYRSSLTAGNLTTVKNILLNTCDEPQPSARFLCVYNSTSVLKGIFDYRDGDLKFMLSTTRALITAPARYDSTIQPWITSGKVKRISCLWEVLYSTATGGQTRKRVERQNYQNYFPDYENKDWNIWVSTYNPAPH